MSRPDVVKYIDFFELSHEERERIAEEDPEGLAKFHDFYAEKVIEEAEPFSQHRLRALHCRAKYECSKAKNPLSRAAKAIAMTEISLLELNAHLQGFTNMVGDE